MGVLPRRCFRLTRPAPSLHPAPGHAPPPGRFSSERESRNGNRHASGPASGKSRFLLRPLRQAPRLLAGRPRRRATRPQPPRRSAKGPPRRGHSALARHPWHPARLAARHRPCVRHRRDGNGALVAAGRPRRRRRRLRKFWRRLGERRPQAAQTRKRPPVDAPYGKLPDSPRSISPATSSSPGTAPLPVCASPTPTASPTTAPG